MRQKRQWTTAIGPPPPKRKKIRKVDRAPVGPSDWAPVRRSDIQKKKFRGMSRSKSPEITFLRETKTRKKRKRRSKTPEDDHPDVFLNRCRRKKIQFSKAISRLKPVVEPKKPERTAPARRPSPTPCVSAYRHPDHWTSAALIPAQPPPIIDLSEEPVIQAQARSVKYKSFYEDQEHEGLYFDPDEKALFDSCVRFLRDLERKAQPPEQFYPESALPNKIYSIEKIVDTFKEIAHTVRFTIKNPLRNLHQELDTRIRRKINEESILPEMEDFLTQLFKNPFRPSEFPPTRVLKQLRNYIRFRMVALEPLSEIFAYPPLNLRECKEFLQNTFENDDDLREDYFILTLTDSYSLKRFEYPGRGLDCNHRKVFDLKLFIDRYALEKKGICPICEKLVPFKALRFDSFIFSIVQETDLEVSQVRMTPDGKYCPFQPQENRRTEQTVSSSDDEATSTIAVEQKHQTNFIDLRFDSKSP